jgi:putative membrane protein
MRRSVRFHHHALCLPLAAALACGGGRPPVRASSTPAPARATAPRITRIADANTAAILLTSHNADLAAARVAATRARHRDVKLLARNMVTDHASMSSRLSRLLASVNLTPREDDVSRLLRDQSAARRDTLRALSGRQFDSAYVENEVRFHQDLLVAIDRVFLPSVRNASLKEHVTTMRPTIASHLALAEQVRATITEAR